MEQSSAIRQPGFEHLNAPHEAHASGVSWAAVFAGAVATAALSLILLSLGAGLGLSAVSPWSGLGASRTVIGSSVILWLILMQVLSGSLGGYLAGRLRTKWASIHNDEVYFRDTAHGFLSWGVALVTTVAFLASAATVMVGSTKPAAPAGGASGAEGQALDANAYYVDLLLRVPSTPVAVTAAVTADVRGEVGRTFMKAMAQGEVSASDRSYLSQAIVEHTGIAAADADKRVSDVFAMAQEAVDAVRKATAHSLLWIFAAVLAGAFFSSLAATIGGSQRDRVIVL